MPSATRAFIDRIALVFDFDLTLAPGTIDAVLARFDIDSATWRKRELDPLIENGWDEIQAKGMLLRRLSRAHGDAITRDFLEEVGRGLEPFPEAQAALERLCELGRECSGGAEVELYILSSGFTDIITSTPIAPLFRDVWGSAFYFDGTGAVDGVKRAIISIEKARYLTALAKGIGVEGANEPAGVDRDVPAQEWHVPLDQMLYVGDGASDLIVQRHGGIAVGVLHAGRPEDWKAARHMHARARVENLAPPEFAESAPMRRILTLAVKILGKRVALRRLALDAQPSRCVVFAEGLLYFTDVFSPMTVYIGSSNALALCDFAVWPIRLSLRLDAAEAGWPLSRIERQPSQEARRWSG